MTDEIAKRTRGPQRPTIRDVSRLAGVSRMTVTRVFSEPDRVVPATREKVAKAIADLGYVPDKAAGSLTTKRTGFIALMLPTLTNANFSLVAHGLTEVLRERDYHLLIAYTNYDTAEEERQLANLLTRRPEAIVLIGAVQGRLASRMLMNADIPIVETSDLPSHPAQHAVGFSNYQVGREAARYLVDKGFAHIGAVGGLREGTVGDFRGEERLRGFEDELRFSGRSTANVLRHGRAPVSFDQGAKAIGLLLEREPRLDAVFAVSDLSAVGVVMECQRRKIAVPEQLSVMGFGNFEIGREINPPLTTITVDFLALGRRAGTLVLELLTRGADDAAEFIDVGMSILERDSVRMGLPRSGGDQQQA